MRRILVLLAALLAASLAPPPAGAGHCADRTLVTSFYSASPFPPFGPSTPTHTAACAAWEPAGVETVDGRVIPTGADLLRVRFTEDHGIVTLVARLDGLGLAGAEALWPVQGPGADYTYRSREFPVDALATGTLHIRVYHPRLGLLDEVEYRRLA